MKDIFGYERLDVFRAAFEAQALVVKYRGALKGLPGEVASQLERAMVSTVANIAEGYGRKGKADRKQRWAIARAEANEAGAMMAIVGLHGVLDAADYEAVRTRLRRVVYMLTAMLR